MKRPLEGVQVIEVATWAYVPSAAAVLADWGADVVKIESPSSDPMRGLTSGGVENIDKLVPPWEMFNRGKRAIALDLSHPEGQAIVHELVSNADVFLTSFLPETRRKLRIDDETIRGINPRIVYGSGTGQGPRGPEAEKGAFDAITFWARGGIAAALVSEGSEPAPLAAGAFGDSLSGMALAGGVSAALVQAARTGEGAVVDGSLLGTALWAMQLALATAATGGLVSAPRMTRESVRNPLVNTYRTSDGRWISLCMLQPDRYWAPFCEAIGRADLSSDPRFVSPEARNTHIADAVVELDGVFAGRTLAEWIPCLSAQGGQWAVVRHISELLDDQQVHANGFVQWVEYENSQQLPLVANPVQFGRTPPALGRAPEFNADCDEILLSLGWDDERILNAKISGAVI